jgi:MFS family permease
VAVSSRARHDGAVGARQHRTPTASPGLLGERDFRLLFSAYAVSCVGDALAVVALTIRAHDLTGSGWAVSAILLASVVPMVALAPVAGRLIDGRETVGVLRSVSLLATLVAIALAFTGNVAALVALAVLLGAAFAVTHPGLFALVPEIAGDEHLAQANGYLELARWGGGVVGPVLGGLLAASGGSRVALLGDATTFVILAAALGAVGVRRLPSASDTGTGEPDHARYGLSTLVGDPVLRLVVGVIVALVLTTSMVDVAEVFLAKGVLRAGDLGYGTIMAAWGAGVAVAVAGFARRVTDGRLVSTVLGAAAGVSAAYLVAASSAHLAVVVLAFFAGGVANGLGLVAVRTLLQQRAPRHARGRVLAAYGALVTGAQLGAFGVGGVGVSVLGARGVLLAAGLAGLVVAFVGVLVHMRTPLRATGRPVAA